MPMGKKTGKTETTAESYDHKQETSLRPDVGLQAQFKQNIGNALDEIDLHAVLEQ